MISTTQQSHPGLNESRQNYSSLIDSRESKRTSRKINFFGLLAFLVFSSGLAFQIDAYANNVNAKTAAVACEGGGSDCPSTPRVYAGDSGFRKSFLALLRAAGMQKPDWIPNGASSPMTTVVVDGKKCIIGEISEPHNAPHQLIMLYAIDSGRMVALSFDEDGKGPTFLGSPTAAERKAFNNRHR